MSVSMLFTSLHPAQPDPSTTILGFSPAFVGPNHDGGNGDDDGDDHDVAGDGRSVAKLEDEKEARVLYLLQVAVVLDLIDDP